MHRVSNNIAFFCLLILIIYAPSGVTQKLIPFTGDIQVDQEPPQTRAVGFPAIAVNNQGAVMIAWAEEKPPTPQKIFGRIYTDAGASVTSVFRIDENMDETSTISGPIDIAADANGNFFVVWEEYYKETDYRIYGRIYEPDGSAVGKAQYLENDPNDTTNARSPALAIKSSNKVMVAWIKNNSEVWGRIFDIGSSGDFFEVIDEIRLDQNTNPNATAQDPDVATSPNGYFVVTWVDNRRLIDQVTGTPLVYARQFTSNGNPLGNDFVVNENNPVQFEYCSAPAVVVDSDSNMIFCWNDGRNFNRFARKAVYSRTFNWNHVAQSEDMLINTCITDDHPKIGIDDFNNFTILFSQNVLRDTDPDTALDHLFALRYRPGYDSIDSKTQIDQGLTIEYTPGEDLAVSNDGKLYTTWITNVLIDSINSVYAGHVYFNIFGETDVVAPTNLTPVSISTRYVIWKWEWAGSDVQNYRFHIKDENDNIIIQNLPATNLTWEEQDLLPNIRISRRVVAEYNGRESEPSNEVILYTRAEVPTNLRLLTVTEKNIRIAWDGDRASRFAIERTEELGGQPMEWTYIVDWDDDLKQSDFTDSELEPSTVYFYRVRAYNGDSLITQPTSALRVVTQDIFMQAPTLFSGVSLSDSIIQWQWQDNATNESGYLILDENDNSRSPTLSANSKSFTETGLRPNVLYRRKVVCVDKKGNRSESSNLAEIATLASPPINLQAAEIAAMSVKLEWVNLNATAFLIQRAEDENGPWETLVDWDDQYQLSEFTDTNLTPDKSYWYWVQSYNQKGISNPKNQPVQIITPAFAAPTAFWGEALSTDKIAWHWQDNSEGEKGFYIISAENDTISKLLSSDIETWTETNLSANQAYIRSVLVVPPSGEGLYNSNTDTLFTLAFPPSDLRISDSTSTSVGLQWAGNGASRFMIERATSTVNDTLNWEIIAGWSYEIIEPNYLDTGLSPNTQYAYRIRGYNGDKILTIPSEVVIFKTPTSILAPPTNLQATAVSPHRIDWIWQDNTEGEAFYRIKDENRIQVTADLPANTTVWSDSNLNVNTRYSRQIFAVTQSGVESGGSNLVSRYTLAMPPSQVKIYRIPGLLTLNWYGNDGSYFDIERAPDDNGRPGEWQRISSAVKDTLFQDSAIETNKSYWYRIFAFNGDSIRTANSSERVFAPTGNLLPVKGDLNQNFALDFEDLNRLVEIILQQGPEPDSREQYVANYYDTDDVIDINDIISLIDTLLVSPHLFRTNLEANEKSFTARLESTSDFQFDGAQLLINGSHNFHSLAVQLSVDPVHNQAIQAVFEPNQANLIASSRFVAGKFRLIASQVNPISDSPQNSIQVYFLSNNSEDIRIKLEKVHIITEDKKTVRLRADNDEIVLKASKSPSEFRLLQNYPNPFNAQTEIRFNCASGKQNVSLIIYNLLGQKIATLIDNEQLSGIQKVKWKAQDDLGHDVPSGIYLYHLTIDGQRLTKKLILIR
jgi:hypothetical protein